MEPVEGNERDLEKIMALALGRRRELVGRKVKIVCGRCGRRVDRIAVEVGEYFPEPCARNGQVGRTTKHHRTVAEGVGSQVGAWEAQHLRQRYRCPNGHERVVRAVRVAEAFPVAVAESRSLVLFVDF